MSICTGRGKDGDTDLLFGKRISKADSRIGLGGSLDELNAQIGVVRCLIPEGSAIATLDKVQQNLVAIMGEVATLPEDLSEYKSKGYSRLEDSDKEWLVEQITAIESGENSPRFRGWVRPGESDVMAGAFLDVCRTLSRRVEHLFWSWDTENHYLLHKRYLNNLSDLFWLLAREIEKSKKV